MLFLKGKFVTEEEYPKFVRQEIIVNAVTHRDYSIRGTDIQVKMFDDRIVVESPGRLPGLVKKMNYPTDFNQKNDRSLSEVLTERNLQKLKPLLDYLEKHDSITPKQAEQVIKNGKI